MPENGEFASHQAPPFPKKFALGANISVEDYRRHNDEAATVADFKRGLIAAGEGNALSTTAGGTSLTDLLVAFVAQ
jgi:hypothetical protein